ncbi:MAG: sulfatase-like hydrolase/transferase, partial [Gemmatimonadales bacterium]|nr:sulfatase-like hydrolase/transferase [Gemmatimonadales bacterium]
MTGPRPNVILIEVCSLRYDHLGCTGYARPTSPTIDSLAVRGTLFRRCIGASSWTKPSTASILTSLSPGVHRLTYADTDAQIRGSGFTPRRVLSPEAVTL